MLLKRSPEARRRLEKLSYLLAALVFFIGAYIGVSEAPFAPPWLVALNGFAALANLVAACFAGRADRRLAVVMEGLSGVLLLATAGSTYFSGARHHALGLSQLFAGAMFLGVSAFHVRKCRQTLAGEVKT